MVGAPVCKANIFYFRILILICGFQTYEKQMNHKQLFVYLTKYCTVMTVDEVLSVHPKYNFL
jgi:hypothetical protein